MMFLFLAEICLHFNWVAQEFNFRPCPWIFPWYLEYNRPSFQWNAPHESDHTVRDILSKQKLFYFNKEWNAFNSSPPFTISTNTHKFAASTACILNVAHFVPTSACHFSFFSENSYVVAAGPKNYTANFSADHPVLPLPATFCCPDVGAAVVPVPPPIPFPPTTTLCNIMFPPISTLYSFCDVVTTLGALPSTGNVVACFVSLPAAPQ